MTTDIALLIPGGQRPSDFLHNCASNDGSCSRCVRQISRYAEPLTVYTQLGHWMLIYCPFCLAPQANQESRHAPAATH